MDLSKLNTKESSEKGASLHLRSPTGDLLFDEDNLDENGNARPVTITIAGQDSTRYKKAQHKFTNQRLDSSISQGRRLKIRAEALESEGLDLIIECTLGWSGIKVEGEQLECTPRNIRKVYTDFPWVAEQVDQFISDRANFLGNS